MKLSELRRITVRKQLRVRFTLPEGVECVVDEHGLAQVPGLRSIPNFNIENSFSKVTQFRIEPAEMLSKIAPRAASVAELEQILASMSPTAGVAAADHDE